ncbi:hypothetical protein MMC30_007155 [Trapelia coarctata]|nr:hypothetical protein [Trapelia coarctata]
MLATTAYLVRGLQLFLRTSKRATTERAEEMGAENDTIPLTEPNRAWSTTSEDSHLPSFPSATQDPSNGRSLDNNSNAARGDTQEVLATTILRQDPIPLTHPQTWAAWVNLYLDILTYALIFLFAGLPVYITTGYAMPIQLSLSVLTYQAALALPPTWKRFLHPVLVSSALTIIGIWILALCRRETIQDGLHAYSTKTKYLQIWSGNSRNLPMLGTGDIFGSVLDVSIVALALPMFQYRKELQRHFLAIVLPNIAISIASLFGYPALCYAIGIESKRSLSFAARSLTLALATPATTNLGGDLNLVAVLCIMSGILGVLMGPAMLKWLKIPEGESPGLSQKPMDGFLGAIFMEEKGKRKGARGGLLVHLLISIQMTT